MNTKSLALFSCAALVLSGCAQPAGRTGPDTSGVHITELPDRLRVEINGQLFTEYHYRDVPRPYCYPVFGPDELPMTRNWPMKDVPDETHDHPHHRSLWFAHGAVDGQDFWSEQKEFGRTVHERFLEIRSGRNVGVIRSRNKWVAHDGTVKCTDERTLRFYDRPANERLFDFEITIHASHGPVTFGDTKEGTMAMRLNETMRLKPNAANAGKPTGHIVNSRGVRDGDTWGKRADWCDYYGPVEGRTVGVAIFDHPQNPRHPTWWHVRDYGLFAANPFGEHDFERLPDQHAGDLVLPAGQSVTFRYRFYLHEGDEQQAKVAEHYAEYVRSALQKN
jgi:hypothetical protein